MPKTKVERQDILRAAAKVIELYGIEGLNARNVAKEMGASTQPVYSQFGSMDGLVAALREEGARLYREKIDGYLSDPKRNRYEAYGMGFAKFARDEKGLFRLLYLLPSQGGGYFHEKDPYLEEILSVIQAEYGMSREEARAFHADVAIFSCGLAMLVNFGNVELSEEETELKFKRQFYAQYALKFPERASLMREFSDRAEERLCKTQSKSNT